jgi:hypothetical protein
LEAELILDGVTTIVRSSLQHRQETFGASVRVHVPPASIHVFAADDGQWLN